MASLTPRSTRMRRVLVVVWSGLFLAAATPAWSQVPFPPDGLVNATTQQTALAVIGAAQAEPSTHLLVDVPDIALPGPLSIEGKSMLPGTTHLVLLRVTRVPPRPPAPREKPMVAARRIEPGKPASLATEIDAVSTLSVVLLAQARGKWFYAQREVKIGRPGSTHTLP